MQNLHVIYWIRTVQSESLTSGILNNIIVYSVPLGSDSGPKTIFEWRVTHSCYRKGLVFTDFNHDMYALSTFPFDDLANFCVLPIKSVVLSVAWTLTLLQNIFQRRIVGLVTYKTALVKQIVFLESEKVPKIMSI